MSERKYRFVFVVGAQGSGTTLLTRMLSRPDTAVALGGNYVSIPSSDKEAFALAEAFGRANADLWDRKASLERYEEAKRELARILERLLRLPSYADVSHVVYKRSAPFFTDDRHRPDLSDLLILFKDLRIIVIYRDPRACAFSALRRGFAENLRHSAVMCDEQLTYLAAQLATLNEDRYRVISYDGLCSQPRACLEALAAFGALRVEDVLPALGEEELKLGQNERWRRELDGSEVAFLESFFDPRRLAQWRLLSEAVPLRAAV